MGSKAFELCKAIFKVGLNLGSSVKWIDISY